MYYHDNDKELIIRALKLQPLDFVLILSLIII